MSSFQMVDMGAIRLQLKEQAAEIERLRAVVREWLRADVALKRALNPGKGGNINAVIKRVRAAKKAARALGKD